MRRDFLRRCLCGTAAASVGTVCGPAFGALLAGESAAAPADPSPTNPARAGAGAVSRFPLSRVRLLDGPCLDAQRTDLRYLMALDPDRLLAPFRREAGLPLPKPSYGNWESSGLDGHMGGHYVSALAMMAAGTGDDAVRARLRQVLAALRHCQLAHGDGYLGGIPDGKLAWREIARGELKVDSFSVNGRWVPWYNLHKTFAGLRDAWVLTGEALARVMLIDLGAWALTLLEPLSDAQLQDMMRAEHGGMNEILADVAAMTGDARFLRLAERFSHRAVLDPLRERRDALTGLHANTQIPKVIGFARIAELRATMPGGPRAGGDAAADGDWLDPARFFWHTVRERRSVATGGNSVKEHFHALEDFQPMLDEVEGPETCNTYNMLKLTELLHAHAADDRERARYADYYERALFNHILASQHPSGGFVYFTPMRPNHYRVYSQVHLGMWCCVGSGLESHARHGQFVYSRVEDTGDVPALFVNLFVSSSLDWREQGLRLSQHTRFPDEGATRLRIDAVVPADGVVGGVVGGDAEARTTGAAEVPASRRFALKIRHPGWLAPGALRVKLNGRPIALSADDARPGGYLTITRDWRAGDVVDLRLPMRTTLEPMPTRTDYVAVLRGPIVLAARTRPIAGERLVFRAGEARMDHIAQGAVVPLSQAPLFVSAAPDFGDRLAPVPGRPLTFSAGSLPQGPDGASVKDLVLEPFFRLHDTRYVVYWPYSTPAEARSRRDRLARDERERLALQARTVDAVAPGEQQPESDHGFAGEGVDTGLHKGRRWRHATAWFSVRLSDPKREGQVLRLAFSALDDGRRFALQVNDRELAELTLRSSALPPGEEIYTRDFALPADWPRPADGSLRVRLVASPGSIAGGVYDLRLLKASDPDRD
ncbi:beta-L-arabinofuranosidase domain-containing protein [Roseateles sp. UC29_93]|uniref:beta-L-arabinofuranosidase domain-containing protein n=1 Tax=Roseateles sp. UC29_93 TaxID=3350177 RepID=UPI0036706B61